MRKINTAQFKMILEQNAENKSAKQYLPNAYRENQIPKITKISKDRQEFVNNISASGFQQFHV